MEPFRLTALEAARAIAQGALTSEALVRSCLERIDARESVVHAWAFYDPDLALADARLRDRSPRRGPLHGVPVGMKDIIDTRRMPTAYGSWIFEGHRPKRDAAVVRRAERAGAVVLGKTVTTEFANFPPGPTTNPHNPAHTPGGSSSGSAAAVADGHVPLALGTQTVGSVIRPASFCGIAAFKPTFDALNIQGVHPVAKSLDTLGLFARHPADLWLLFRALLGKADALTPPAPVKPRIAFCITPDWSRADTAMQEATVRAAETLGRSGLEVEEIEFSSGFGDLHTVHETIFTFEVARAYAPYARKYSNPFKPKLQEIFEAGQRVTRVAYQAAQRTAAVARQTIDDMFARYGMDLLLAPSAPGEAPEGLGSTGDPRFNRIWTLLHLPCATLPAGTGPKGLPLSVQVVGPRGGDARLLANLLWVWGALNPSVRLP